MIFEQDLEAQSDALQVVSRAYLLDEKTHVADLMAQLTRSDEQQAQVQALAAKLVTAVRSRKKDQEGVEAFMHEYDLSTEEGIVLMCLAEALLRIPDDETADKLIRDKLAGAHWEKHLGHSHSLFVNASTWGLLLTGKIIRPLSKEPFEVGQYLDRLISRLGEPVIRTAMRHAMKILGHQFVMGAKIDEALARTQSKDQKSYLHSFDMLGESALTDEDAQRYLKAYEDAIKAVGESVRSATSVFARAGISVKLSALHPRYEFAKRERVLLKLVPRLLGLGRLAKEYGIGLTVDAEEAERLELSLEVFECVFRDYSLQGWEGFGLAVQAYQKRAPFVIDWLADIATEHNRRIPVRLVKGAYWDTEIKRAQERGWSSYPVFTRKVHTDLSYLVCAQKLFSQPEVFYPQFATHNAHTVASIVSMGKNRDYEFQRLHGMGAPLYDALMSSQEIKCRVYAPVGDYKDLLPYLVRRLLENGANTSFVSRIEDENIPVEEMIADPVLTIKGKEIKPHSRIPLPADLYGSARINSKGLNFFQASELRTLATAISKKAQQRYVGAPIINGEKPRKGQPEPVFNPARAERIGERFSADVEAIDAAFDSACRAYDKWRMLNVRDRATILRRIADLYEKHRDELIALCVNEAGRTVVDAHSEVREAVDFCRYYAQQAEALMANRVLLPGPTGERNQLDLHGRGVFVCISPWNFPIAIFTGQIVAALVCGNPVLAKPAANTVLIGMRCVELMHEAGVPKEVLHFLPAAGRFINEHLLTKTELAGVCFTGSTETAFRINQTLAQRRGPIIPFIAETGGQNAMIADSSALAEQLALDCITSAFNSAGQRCSALRVLFVQEEIAQKVITLLVGAMRELAIGDPGFLSTDVGPVIDATARDELNAHIAAMRKNARLIAQLEVPSELKGTFVGPALIKLEHIDELEKEHFGPILHIITYKAANLEKVLAQINNTGYGLTLGIHSRIDQTSQQIASVVKAGNIYVNRNMIGAVVGVQPFGGDGLSGTGPKAGGPHYLYRFVTERTLTVNTAAVGGNASLLALEETPDD